MPGVDIQMVNIFIRLTTGKHITGIGQIQFEISILSVLLYIGNYYTRSSSTWKPNDLMRYDIYSINDVIESSGFSLVFNEVRTVDSRFVQFAPHLFDVVRRMCCMD